MFDHRHLVHSLALARHGNFHRAAAAVHLSQLALSRSIQSLEDSLGVRLFDRLPGGVVPTPFGEALLERARRITLDHEELAREMRLMQGLEFGDLSVALGVYPARISGYEAVGRFLRSHPRIGCRLHQRNWREIGGEVAERQADLALGELSEAAHDFRLATEIVGQHAIAMFCRKGHPLLALQTVEIRHLVGYPWVATRMPRKFPARDLAAGRPDQETGDFLPAIQADDISGIVSIVRASDTISGVPLVLLEGELAGGAVELLPFAAPWLVLRYGFVTLLDRTQSPAALAFMEEVRAVETEITVREAELRERYMPER